MTDPRPTKLLRARILLPVGERPFADAGVWIRGPYIVAVGPWSEIRAAVRGPATDLGEVLLLPGFVNAHCHLDYTGLAGQLTPPRGFSEWIKTILAAKAAWGFSEFAASWLTGARQLLETGTTTVANIESVPEMLGEVRPATPLRVHSFLEMTGVRSHRAPAELIAEVRRVIAAQPAGRGGFGFSPHAPYSTLPELLTLTAAAALETGFRVTTHVAESREEFDMFMYRRGPMYEWLKSQRPMEDCGLGSPVRHLHRAGLLGPKVLAVHVNHLWDEDSTLLARHGTHVVHCPRSHRYFRHHHFPLTELRTAGVNVALGTDSLASVARGRGPLPSLSMTAEMATMAAGDSECCPAEILRLATQAGAAALGQAGQIGTITPGALADFAVIPFGGSLDDAEDAVVHHRGRVAATMIGGRWEWRAPGYDALAPAEA